MNSTALANLASPVTCANIASAINPRRVQGERPSAVARRNRHPYPAAVDRAVHVMLSFGTPRLVWVKRNRDNRVAKRIGSDAGAEPLNAHGLVLARRRPGRGNGQRIHRRGRRAKADELHRANVLRPARLGRTTCRAMSLVACESEAHYYILRQPLAMARRVWVSGASWGAGPTWRPAACEPQTTGGC